MLFAMVSQDGRAGDIGGGGVCKGRVNERQYGRELGGRKAMRGEVSIRENVEERKIGNRQDEREVSSDRSRTRPCAIDPIKYGLSR